MHTRSFSQKVCCNKNVTPFLGLGMNISISGLGMVCSTILSDDIYHLINGDQFQELGCICINLLMSYKDYKKMENYPGPGM